MAELRVCALYPRELNFYADRGNLMVLRRRCEWRRIGFCRTDAGIRESVDPDEHDLYVIGGGQDADQRRCTADFVEHKGPAIVAAVTRGAVVLGVGSGYQLLGHSYRIDGETLPGLGLIGVESTRESTERLVGNALIEVDLGNGRRLLTGFENHAGRTTLDRGVAPLGVVQSGHGNNGRDRTEGARVGNVIGTYLHGPLLAKNAWFADWLIATALSLPALPPLRDDLEEAVHQQACERAVP